MTEDQRRVPHYWERYTSRGTEGGDPSAPGGEVRLPPGEDLAAMRRGANRQPGSVPALWKFYTAPDSGGREPSADLSAEHAALVLFGFHQQSQRRSMHVTKESMAGSLRRLRLSDRFKDREETLDCRVACAVTSATLGGLSWHLRGLVTLMRGADLGFNYSWLTADLTRWQRPEGRIRLMRNWGRQYFAWGAGADDDGLVADLSTATERSHNLTNGDSA